ncbi:MAG: GNAT family N-acetyltransferase [Erythrobacter sp.]|jgi:putative acetyltransferase|uniref:GNAT family N-acetyltransferase n=1 Tax=Erythrobacter sp. TaxID=1042 RepID=UPI002B47FE36|nr:GNAT family N-acetyltransferase [Erythrobacter sp.]WRH70694.1 MAG: GNAT family N-acetyltransferase [Erythrobacter sp.]
MTMRIEVADLEDPEVQALIAYHQRAMLEGSPPGLSFALDLSGLQAEGVCVWAAYVEGRVAAIGALKRLDDKSCEIKSMRTHPEYLRQGIAAALLETIITQARLAGFKTISLETGTGPAFEPALALYRRRGFVNGAAFADYTLTDFNQCLHLALD